MQQSTKREITPFLMVIFDTSLSLFSKSILWIERILNLLISGLETYLSNIAPCLPFSLIIASALLKIF